MMSLQGTVLPSTEDTRSYLIGLWCFLSSWRNDSFSALRIAGRSSTGMFTSPNARAPFQMDAMSRVDAGRCGVHDDAQHVHAALAEPGAPTISAPSPWSSHAHCGRHSRAHH